MRCCFRRSRPRAGSGAAATWCSNGGPGSSCCDATRGRRLSRRWCWWHKIWRSRRDLTRSSTRAMLARWWCGGGGGWGEGGGGGGGGGGPRGGGGGGGGDGGPSQEAQGRGG